MLCTTKLPFPIFVFFHDLAYLPPFALGLVGLVVVNSWTASSVGLVKFGSCDRFFLTKNCSLYFLSQILLELVLARDFKTYQCDFIIPHLTPLSWKRFADCASAIEGDVVNQHHLHSDKQQSQQ